MVSIAARVLAFLNGFAAVAGLIWFFFLLILFGLFLAGGQKTHRVDLPLFAAILILGFIIAVAMMRRLVGRLRRRRRGDVDA